MRWKATSFFVRVRSFIRSKLVQIVDSGAPVSRFVLCVGQKLEVEKLVFCSSGELCLDVFQSLLLVERWYKR